MRVSFAGAIVLGAALTAGCAGGNSSVAVVPQAPSANPSAVSTSTPVPIPSQSPFASQATVVVPMAAPGAAAAVVLLPAGGGFSVALDLPSAGSSIPANVSVAAATQNTLPAGLPALQSLTRSTLQHRVTLQDAPATPFLYLVLSWSAPVRVIGPALTITVPASVIVGGSAYYAALYDPTNSASGWQLGFMGPAAVSGTSMTFTAQGTFTFAAGASYVIGLYATSASAPPPTAAPATPSPVPSTTPSSAQSSAPTAVPSSSASPAPTSAPTVAPSAAPSAVPSGAPTSTPTLAPTAGPTVAPTVTPTLAPTAKPTLAPTATPTFAPTATPTFAPTATPTLAPTPTPTLPPPGVLSVNPAAVSIYGMGVANAQTILVQETPYTAAFGEQDTCNPASGTIATITTASPFGPAATFTVTGVAAGTCTATFRDSRGQSVSSTIAVTINGFTINTSHRKDR